jgi:hypothetical protein
MDTEDIIDIIGPNRPKHKRNLFLVPLIMSVVILAVFCAVLHLNGFSPLLISYPLLLVIVPGTVLHESLHYYSQWYFSRQRPHFGVNRYGPFTALSPGSFITRKQAIVCALAPPCILTPIIVGLALSASLLPRILLLAFAFAELPSSYYDFYLTYHLIKSPPNCLFKNANNTSVLFRPKG